MTLLENVYKTFLENPIENIGEVIKEKAIVAIPYIFGTVFVLTAVIVIVRRVGR